MQEHISEIAVALNTPQEAVAAAISRYFSSFEKMLISMGFSGGKNGLSVKTGEALHPSCAAECIVASDDAAYALKFRKVHKGDEKYYILIRNIVLNSPPPKKHAKLATTF